MISLRPYQSLAINKITDGMKTDRYVLAQAATGAGKTIIFASLIRYFMENYSMRIAIMAHREILVRQAFDKLMKVWPEGRDQVGIACASVGSVDLGRPVIIGSPQTLARRLNMIPEIHLVIIDECHRVPGPETKSQYRNFLLGVEDRYPSARILGVTATPYRLGHGYIYGDKCREGERNWFPRLHTKISIEELQEQGYLCPLRAYQAEDISGDLTGISTSKGEFNSRDLSMCMSKTVHLSSAVNAYKQYGEGREHVVAFCVTIEHAEKLCAAFVLSGIPAAVVHSEMPKNERHEALEDFEAGRVRVICNVGVLTEGWDCTCVDCILFCRPTMSPALYVQMVGRGLRTHPGKSDCLLLDLSGNCLRHGDVNDPVVKIGKAEAPQETVKECERCHAIIPIRAKKCPACGFEPAEEEPKEKEPLQEHENVALRRVLWGDQRADVLYWKCEPYVSRAGNRVMRMTINCRLEQASLPSVVNCFFDVEGAASDYGQKKFQETWKKLTRHPVPLTVDEAVMRSSEMHVPSQITLKQNKQYLNVVRWGE